MNFINKIKSNYLNNLIEGYDSNKQYDDLYQLLIKEKNNPLIITSIDSLIKKNIDDFEKTKLFQNNICWINSFELEDTKYINQFISFYFQKKNLIIPTIDHYAKLIAEQINSVFPQKNNIDFLDLVNNSYLYQYLITLSKKYKVTFANSSAAFFASGQNAFTHHQITSNYIYIVRHPLSLYAKYFKQFNNDQSVLNKFLNFDNKPEDYNFNFDSKKITVQENTQSWAVNVNSWIDANVINTFKGLIVKMEELIAKPEETLADIISHLSLSLPEIYLDYKLISEFLHVHPILDIEQPIDLSNQQKKKILREITTYGSLHYLNYEL